MYKGAALMPKWLANPGAFGYGTAAFDRAYQASPALTQNLAEAKKLIAQAGVAGQTITIGTSSEVSSIAFETAAYQQAAVAIGLKVTLKSVSAQDFINFFTDPSYRKGVDMFPTVNYGDYADPAALLVTVALPGADQNYDNFSDPQITSLLDQAREHGQPGSAGRAGRQGRAAGGADAAVDPDRRPDQRAGHELQADRRDRLVRLHVRAVGGQPRGRGLMSRGKFLLRQARDAAGQPAGRQLRDLRLDVPGPRQRAVRADRRPGAAAGQHSAAL